MRVAIAVVLLLVTGTRPPAIPRLWVNAAGRPTATAQALIASLLETERRGLDPTDYDAAHWQAAAAALEAGQGADDSSIARFDDGLTAAFIRALTDLHRGRVDPAQLGYKLQIDREGFDPTALAGAAILSGRITDALDRAEPRLAQYRQIAVALARYRELAADTTLTRVHASRDTIQPGDPLPDARTLRRWLVALGDLPSTDTLDTDSVYTDSVYTDSVYTDSVYTEELVRGVRSFQQRRGMDSSGILGPETVAALRQPMSWYVRRLELAMERLRWVPDGDTGRVVVVDIPAFRLWVLDSLQSSAPPTLAMNAIVGQAVGKQTPVFAQTMRSVVFRPYWDVPQTIARREIVPALRRNPAYLAENDMELVPETPPEQAIEALLAGRARVRQRPGSGNALGLMKFVFPNDLDIYLHGTPAQQLFQRTRRDFSHGCIRVEQPEVLARYVLSDNSGWTPDRIDRVMHGSKTFEVALARPISVLVFYATAVVWPDGRVAFYSDIYGHDERLDRALRARYSYRNASIGSRRAALRAG